MRLARKQSARDSVRRHCLKTLQVKYATPRTQARRSFSPVDPLQKMYMEFLCGLRLTPPPGLPGDRQAESSRREAAARFAPGGFPSESLFA
jgi:hypothetical protein